MSGTIWMKSSFTSDCKLEMIPVDFVARVSTHLALSSAHFSHECPIFSYNIKNPNMLTYSEIFQFMQEAGHFLNPKPYPEWRQELLQDPSNPLSSLIPYFGETFSLDSPVYERGNLERFLEEERMDDCSLVTRELIQKYVAYCIDMNC
jgi:hypothetical protein